MGKTNIFCRGRRTMLLQVLHYFEEEKLKRGFVLPVEQPQNRACAATGVSLSTITNINREEKDISQTICIGQRAMLLQVLYYFEEEKLKRGFVLPVEKPRHRASAATGVCISTISVVSREENNILQTKSLSPTPTTSSEEVTPNPVVILPTPGKKNCQCEDSFFKFKNFYLTPLESASGMAIPKEWVLPEPGRPYCAGCLRQLDDSGAPLRLASAFHMRGLLATIRPESLAGSDSFTAQWSCAECSGRAAAALRTVQSLIAAAHAREKLAALRGASVDTLPPSCKRALNRELRLARRSNLKRCYMRSFFIDQHGKSPSIHNHQPKSRKKKSSNVSSVGHYPVLTLDGTHRLTVPKQSDDEDVDSDDGDSQKTGSDDDDEDSESSDEKTLGDAPRVIQPTLLVQPLRPSVPLRPPTASAAYPVLTLDGTLRLSVPRQEGGDCEPERGRRGEGDSACEDGGTLIVVDCDPIKTEPSEMDNVGCEVECETDDATMASEFDDATVTSEFHNANITSELDDATVAPESDANVKCGAGNSIGESEKTNDVSVACDRDGLTPRRIMTRQRKRRKT